MVDPTRDSGSISGNKPIGEPVVESGEPTLPKLHDGESTSPVTSGLLNSDVPAAKPANIFSSIGKGIGTGIGVPLAVIGKLTGGAIGGTVAVTAGVAGALGAAMGWIASGVAGGDKYERKAGALRGADAASMTAAVGVGLLLTPLNVPVKFLENFGKALIPKDANLPEVYTKLNDSYKTNILPFCMTIGKKAVQEQKKSFDLDHTALFKTHDTAKTKIAETKAEREVKQELRGLIKGAVDEEANVFLAYHAKYRKVNRFNGKGGYTMFPHNSEEVAKAILAFDPAPMNKLKEFLQKPENRKLLEYALGEIDRKSMEIHNSKTSYVYDKNETAEFNKGANKDNKGRVYVPTTEGARRSALDKVYEDLYKMKFVSDKKNPVNSEIIQGAEVLSIDKEGQIVDLVNKRGERGDHFLSEFFKKPENQTKELIEHAKAKIEMSGDPFPDTKKLIGEIEANLLYDELDSELNVEILPKENEGGSSPTLVNVDEEVNRLNDDMTRGESIAAPREGVEGARGPINEQVRPRRLVPEQKPIVSARAAQEPEESQDEAKEIPQILVDPRKERMAQGAREYKQRAELAQGREINAIDKTLGKLKNEKIKQNLKKPFTASKEIKSEIVSQNGPNGPIENAKAFKIGGVEFGKFFFDPKNEVYYAQVTFNSADVDMFSERNLKSAGIDLNQVDVLKQVNDEFQKQALKYFKDNGVPSPYIKLAGGTVFLNKKGELEKTEDKVKIAELEKNGKAVKYF